MGVLRRPSPAPAYRETEVLGAILHFPHASDGQTVMAWNLPHAMRGHWTHSGSIASDTVLQNVSI
jgi:hypothetical protein